MFLNKENIYQRLLKHMDYARECGVKPEQVLGIFAKGSMNYGFASETSDVDSILIYIPSLEEMCLQEKWLSKDLEFEGEHIDVKDIRELRIQLFKQNINYVQILYTEHFILNPKYQHLFEEHFIDNREVIAHYDMAKGFFSACQTILKTYLSKPTPKNLYNAHRLYYFAERYASGSVYLDCLQIPHGETFDRLWKMKYGLLEEFKNEDICLQEASRIEERTLDLIKLYETKVKEAGVNENAAAALNTGVTEIIRASMAPPAKEITKEEFFATLTHAEERAYYSIVKEIGTEGSISISKLCKTNSISRPVYDNLLNKMKNSNVAEIVNQGVKGTRIKITHAILRADALGG